MKKIVITGGAGFIASHICDHVLAAHPEADLIIVDKLTYAGNKDNLADALKNPRVKFIQADVCNFELMRDVTRDADWVIHTAAESHVEHSFLHPLQFSMTNTIGAHTVIECCRINQVSKIFHMSSDEVYGEIDPGVAVDEHAILNPTTPYSATKGAADLIIQSYRKTYKMPITMIRPCNIYGIRQYPEKIIPKFCMLSAKHHPLPVQGTGKNTRFYMSVTDLCRAVLMIEKNHLPADTYNVCSGEEVSNLDIANMICDAFGSDRAKTIQYVEDRVYNDKRYSVDDSKLRSYGWTPQDKLSTQISQIADWYVQNMDALLAKIEN